LYHHGSGTLRREIGARLRSDAIGEYVIGVNTDPGGGFWVDTYRFTDSAGAMMLRLCYSGVLLGMTEEDEEGQPYESEWDGKFHGLMGSETDG
jgi:hypothetical protein